MITAARRANRVAETAVLIGLRPRGRAGRRLATAASEAAGGGRLWLGLSAAAAVSPRTRPAGRDGAVAWALASVCAFGMKHVARRRRPSLLPALGPPVRSSSMPSSHTAAAVAYATAASLRLPAAGIVVLPLAGTVGWSRSASARHFPSDLAVGALLGVAAGTAVHLALRRRSAAPADGADPGR